MKKTMRNIYTKALLLTVITFMAALSGFAQNAYNHSDETFQTPPNRSGLPLYDQMDEISTSSIVSMQVMNAPEYTSFAADDFIVPDGDTWSIHYIHVAGQFSDGINHTISMMNVYFYTDDDGKPGTFLYNYTGLTNLNVTTIDEYSQLIEIILPEGVNLPGGHYWMSVQVMDNSNNVGYWRWHEHVGLTIEDEYQWKNPGDGFGQGATDWTPASYISWSYFNLAFALYGEGLPDDLSAQEIVMPITGPNLTSTETVSMVIKNEGLNTETGFDVSYQIDGGTVVTENVGSFSLEPNEIGTYTFTTTADLSVPGPYQITASTNLDTDPRPENNSVSKNITNLGEVYPMPATGTSTITTCGATFTDSGGLDGDFGTDDNATTTIYPANEGDMVILTFLTFDASWGGFSVYNGTDMNAPLLGSWFGTNSPGVLTALNPDGALTVHFEGPGWETKPGWSAFISCFTPVPDDFAVLDLSCNIATLFVDDDATLSALVQNYGTTAQSKVVTFTANGTEIGTQTTPVLNTGDTATVSIPFTPSEAGSYTIVASVPTDDGEGTNDSYSIEIYVYPFGSFYESFEGPVFVPENWSQGGAWTRGDNPSAGLHNADCYVDFSSSDTLVTPRLEIHEGDILTFNAMTTPWWVGNLEIWWLNEETGVWSYIDTPTLSSFSYGTFDVDVSVAAGTNRIGFMVNVTDPWSFAGDVYLDNIVGQGITVYRDDYDLKAKELTGNDFYTLNAPSDFHFVVRNDGLMDVEGSSYNVNLMMQDGESSVLLTSLPGQDVQSSHEVEFDFSYTFTDIDNSTIYAEVDYADDQFQSNNASNELPVIGLAEGSDIVDVGNDIYWGNVPIDFSIYQSLSETIYTSDEIGQNGVLFGIAYDLNFATERNDVPVRIWVGETTQADLPNTWIPATDLKLVYDGTIDYAAGVYTKYIPFQTPYKYNDPSKNLVIMTERIDDVNAVPDYSQIFFGYLSNNTTMILSGGDWITIDPNNPSGGYNNGINPDIHFVFNPNVGSLQGHVTELNGSALQDVQVVLPELGIVSSTDASGYYAMPYVPAGSFQATASKYEYLPSTQTAEITSDNLTTLNFVLSSLNMLTVSGRVVGNDDPNTGIANATISVSGYNSYSATTDADGYFTIEDVYSDNTYSIEVSSVGYDTYTNNFTLSNEDLTLDDIVLAETLEIPYVIQAADEGDYAHISWQTPNADAAGVLSYDDGENEDGFAGEPYEEVWLGDFFPINELSTVTSFDIYWATYNTNNTPQTMRLDILDEDANLIVSSENFMSGEDEWVNVDIPNLTLQGNYYVMVYWSGAAAQSTFLAFDTISATTPNYAYYMYPGGTPDKLSNITGEFGTFIIHANIMTEQSARSENAMVGYNVYRGLMSDIDNANDWQAINTSAVTDNSYDDYTWPSVDEGTYIYAIRALYTTGESEMTFSNEIDVLTGIEPVAKLNVSVYPNPAKTHVNIMGCKDAKLTVFSPQGQLMMSREINNDSYDLNVADLASGVYSLIIQSNTETVQQKLIIVK